MSHPLRRALWLSLLVACQAARGERAFAEFLVDTWTTEEGLPSSTISDVVQTPDGYLWVGTYDGLVRFDGVRFVRVGPDDSMEARRVLCVHFDGTKLLLGTDGAGLLAYDGHRFTTALEAEPGSSFNVVRAIEQDAEGDLWLGTRGGLGRWRDGKVTWITTTAGYTNAANSIWNLALDHQGVLWVTDWVSLKSFRNGRFTTEVVPDRKPMRAVYPTEAGEVWGGMVGRIVRRGSQGEWIAEEVDFGNTEVAAFCRTSTGELWLGTRKGLYQQRHGKWVRFRHGGLDAAEVRVLFEDREGNLWVGTGTGGLARLKQRLVTTYGAADGLTDGAVLAVRVAGQRAWAGSADGRVFELDDEGFRPCADANALGAPVRSMIATRDGSVWIGTFGNGLVRRDGGPPHERRNGAVAPYQETFLPAIGTFARVDKITSLLEDRAGTIWVGTFYSLYRFAGSNLLVKMPVGGREILAQVTALLEGRQGVWAGFEGAGVARISGDGALWLTRRDGLPNHFVRALHEDEEGALWIGTTAGLSCWREGVLSTWTSAHGLLNEAIVQIVEDAAGDLWLGTKAGIMRLRKEDLRAVADGKRPLLDVFACGRGEGMTSVECSGNSGSPAARTSDGRLWFPTTHGLVAIDPARLATRRGGAPRVHIEEVRVDGKLAARPHVSPAPARTVAAKPNMEELPPGTRRVEFAYTAPALTNPERVKFRHRLAGFDSDWTDAGAARTAIYNKLTPGDYRFEVIASNNDGAWSESGHPYAFRVLAPFWKRWWFIGLTGLVTVSSLGAMVRFVSLRHLRRKLARLEEAHAIEKERMRIAQDMHDEIGGKLSRISFLSEMAVQSVPATSEAGQQIDQVSETARDVIRTVDEIVWAVSPRNDTLDSAIHYICRHAEEFFELTPIELELQLPGEVPARRLSADVRHNLFCAVKEALNNVLKHAGATRVRIAIAVQPATLEVRISDNGRGFDIRDVSRLAANGPSAAHEGDGLLNMRERLEAVSGRFVIESERQSGTTILFCVPLSRRSEITNRKFV